MFCRQFLSWAQRAPAGERADAARDLAHAFLYAETDRIERGEMERAMAALLDDPAAVVRRALAEALAGAEDAPHHIVATLAYDQPDVAIPILSRSPLLTDAELVDAVAIGGPQAQCAIARRASLSAAVAGAIAEVGSPEAVLALCRNHGADLAEISADRILERLGRDGAVRESLSARPDVSAALRHRLTSATAEALNAFAVSCGWLTPARAHRIAVESLDRAALTLGREAASRGFGPLETFVATLRQRGQLTPSLLLRILLEGEIEILDIALADLSGHSLERVAALTRHPGGLGFVALLNRAGLPDALVPVFRAVLHEMRQAGTAALPLALRRRLVDSALRSSAPAPDRSLPGLMAMLRMFEAEAARDEARALVARDLGPHPRLEDLRPAA